MEKKIESMIFMFNNRYISYIDCDNLSDIKDWRNQQMNILRQWKPLTYYNQQEWFKRLSTDLSQVIFSLYFSEDNENFEFIGYCGVVNIDFINRRGEISFIVNPKRVKNNKLYHDDFMAVLTLLCHYGFESLNLNKLFTETFSFREEHINILNEFGFIFEGKLRNHQFINGNYCDSIMHSILFDEWFGKLGDVKIVLDK